MLLSEKRSMNPSILFGKKLKIHILHQKCWHILANTLHYKSLFIQFQKHFIFHPRNVLRFNKMMWMREHSCKKHRAQVFTFPNKTPKKENPKSHKIIFVSGFLLLEKFRKRNLWFIVIYEPIQIMFFGLSYQIGQG